MAKIFVSYTINSTSKFFLVARESDNPLAIVYKSDVLNPPHVLRNVTIDHLNPVMHQVELWSTVDGVNLSQLRARADIDASQFSTIAFEPLQFVVDMGRGTPYFDPVDTDTVYTNPDILTGLIANEYIVFKPGFGALNWGLHIAINDTGNGFKYVNGQEFASGEEYTIMINRLTTKKSTDGSGAGYPDGIVSVTANLSFTSAHYNKLLEVSGGNNLTITIDALETLPENMKFGINTHAGARTGTFKNITLQLPAGKYALVDGEQQNSVYICRGENVEFMKKGNYLRILNWEGDRQRVGQRVYTDGLPPLNSVPLIGGWQLITDCLRIVNWHVLKLLPGEVIFGTDDSTPSASNRVKWILGATKVWFPDHGGYFYRPVDPDGNIDPDGVGRPINQIQADDNREHNHTVFPYNKAIAKASDVDGTNTPGGVDSNNPSSEYRVAAMDNTKWNAATITNQGSESRPKNLSQNLYVII